MYDCRRVIFAQKREKIKAAIIAAGTGLESVHYNMYKPDSTLMIVHKLCQVCHKKGNERFEERLLFYKSLNDVQKFSSQWQGGVDVSISRRLLVILIPISAQFATRK